MRMLTRDYFVVLAINSEGNLGRGRFELRKAELTLAKIRYVTPIPLTLFKATSFLDSGLFFFGAALDLESRTKSDSAVHFETEHEFRLTKKLLGQFYCRHSQ